MAVLNVSTAWKPENGFHYTTVEVRMNDDFQRADAALWGIVEAKGLTNTTTFDVLRIVGRPEWHPRFDWTNDTHPWQQALGGAPGGGTTALAGLMFQDCKRLRIKRLEVIGVPGPGIRYARSGLEVGSAGMLRVGWPIYGDYDSVPGAQVSGLTSAGGHWWARAWGPPGVGSDPRGVSLRRLDATHQQRGELVLNAASYILEGYVHHGDGISFKVAGTEFLVSHAHAGAGFFNGTVPSNLVTFPDPVRYKHLHESRNCFCIDSEFVGNECSVRAQPHALVYVSYPFTDPLTFRRCVFVRGPHGFAFQVNWANVVFDDCDFIGWTEANAFELSPAHDGMPPGAVTHTGSRFWDS